MGRHHPTRGRGQAEGRVHELGREVGRVPAQRVGRVAAAMSVALAGTPFAPRRARHRERGFRLALVAPSIFVLLLMGVFPLAYLVVVSVQNITMTDVDTSF